MKKIGLICAMSEELELLLEGLEEQQEYTIANMSFYAGSLEGMQVVLVLSGIGKVNASIAASLLISKFEVDAVVNTGVAGAIDQKLEVGDIVIGQRLAYHDVDVRNFGYKLGQIPQMPLFYEASSTLLELIKENPVDIDASFYFGDIVSSDTFVMNSDMGKEIKSEFPHALVTEMEGAAVGQTSYQFSIPFLVIRAVSDNADQDATITYDEFLEEASHNSARFILSLLKNIKRGEQR